MLQAIIRPIRCPRPVIKVRLVKPKPVNLKPVRERIQAELHSKGRQDRLVLQVSKVLRVVLKAARLRLVVLPGKISKGRAAIKVVNQPRIQVLVR